MAGSGEWSDTMDATQEIQKICDQEKRHVEKMTMKNYGDFKAVVYRKHTVTEGQNYVIKVQVGEKDYIQLNLFQVDGKVTVRGFLEQKTKEDPLLVKVEVKPFPGIGPVVIWSETMDANEETQKICDQVKPQVEEKTGKNYREFKAVKYRNQIWEGGENFLIKVHVGGKDYIHLAVLQTDFISSIVPFQSYILTGVQQHKTKEDPLVPFE